MISLRGTSAPPRVLIITPGPTEFDDQGRIKGSLDVPMTDDGSRQVDELIDDIGDLDVKTIHTAPGESCRDTADRLASRQSGRGREVRVKVVENLRNVDHGLWHGKLIDEVKRQHPKTYRRGQESAEEICPPGGEPVAEAKQRVAAAIRRLAKKASGPVVVVLPNPLAAIAGRDLAGGDGPVDLWTSERDHAAFHWFELAGR